MNISLLSEGEIALLRDTINASDNIILCCHRSPDGDAIGSMLGWAEYLKAVGKLPTCIIPDAYPDFLQWLPGTERMMRYDKHAAFMDELIDKADLIFCLDFNSASRTDGMAEKLSASKAKKILIDHHLNPDLETVLSVSRPEASSTCELVFRLVWQLGEFDKLDRKFAIPVYCGMMTDTGGFTYNSTNPEIFYIISLLLTKKINKDKIYRNVFHVFSTDRIRLTGYVLYEKLQFFAGNIAAVFTLTREEMKRFHFIRGDAEGLVNMPLQVKGMKLSISLREDTERDVVRVSLRSVDDFPCNRMAEEFFNGGGHLNASGGELPFPLEEAEKTAQRAIEAYQHLL